MPIDDGDLLPGSAPIESSFATRIKVAKRAELARRALTAELACALRVPESTAGRLITESEALATELPETLATLRAGEISYRHAQVVIDHATSLPVESRTAFESAILPAALTSTAAQFERTARAERERRHPESLVTRAQKAARDRRVCFEADRDGMAWLHHYLPAVDAVRIDDTLEQLARSLRDAHPPAAPTAPSAHGTASNPLEHLADQPPAAREDAPDACAEGIPKTEARTIAQLRSDVLVDLLLRDSATGEPRSLVPTVIVTVPVLTLLGHADTPASLDGYGPIDAETARKLAAHAPSFVRLLTHPETGATLSVGRDRYRPPADLRMALEIEDRTCRFPGCSRSARRCELDHTIDWADNGPTARTNLAHLCPKHHHLKHETAWAVSIDATRTLHWQSPAGRRYATTPASPPSVASVTSVTSPPSPAQSPCSSAAASSPPSPLAPGAAPF
ncbi:HNH endonuclease signature motif containing protein [Subtercola lobariae]|uniref:HNH nuclease domain-containing protein n=1 Tax=Subtercola lobariae TaxID=1588641 RepID=A0A917BI23_9MICO|nr:HNH endonuclease signature motif containing protein [Subtercola lobariae]GGF40142.1 hypothetical protein GCM10011399_36240 [Subtercola lobariae]